MADLAVVPASVGPNSSGTVARSVQVGAAVTAGQPLYRAADTKYYPCDALTEEAAQASVVAISDAVADGYVYVATPGVDLLLGVALTTGVMYAVSATSGGIAPIDDLTAGQFITTLGIARDATALRLRIDATGVTV